MRVYQAPESLFLWIRDSLPKLLPGTDWTAEEVNRAHWWAAYSNTDEYAGFAGITTHEQPPGEGFLLACAVLPDWRRYGVQTRLIRARVAWARRQGLERVWTCCNVSNTPSLRNLLRAGFLPIGAPAGEFIDLELKL